MNFKILHFVKWNSASFLVQTVLSLLALPIYLKKLSDYDFVVVSLVWSIASIASVMDFGLSRYITHQLASNLNTQRQSRSYFFAMAGYRTLGLIAALSTFAIAIFMLIYFKNVAQFKNLSITFIFL